MKVMVKLASYCLFWIFGMAMVVSLMVVIFCFVVNAIFMLFCLESDHVQDVQVEVPAILTDPNHIEVTT